MTEDARDQRYSAANPLLAAIKRRVPLCKLPSGKETVHIEIDLADSELSYSVGDSLGIVPFNDEETVSQILAHFGAAGDESIVDPKSHQAVPLSHFLTFKAQLNEPPRKLLEALLAGMAGKGKKEDLDRLLQHSSLDAFKRFQQEHDVLDTLLQFREAALSPQEFCATLKPLLPRFYSIASSQQVVGNQVDLTVALKQWEAKEGKVRRGLCSHYLCRLAPLHSPEIPVYIHPHKGFTLPKEGAASVIMIGPGTGVAPFRGFMQERVFTNAAGKNWLFFGEWHRSHYFYEEFWQALAEKGKLKVDAAFSRDQQEKVYVQHRMLEQGKELYKWLQEGAYVYVCGDALRMAKDVEAALLEIVKQHGNLSQEQGREYIKTLRREKRYLRDVY